MFDCHFKRLSSARGSAAQRPADTEHEWLLLLHTGGYCGREGAKTICYVATVSSQDPGDVANFLRLVASSASTVRLQTTNHTSTMSTHKQTHNYNTHTHNTHTDFILTCHNQPSDSPAMVTLNTSLDPEPLKKTVGLF